MNSNFLRLSLILLGVVVSKPGFCGNWAVDFGPFAGAGRSSGPEKIRHSTGISFAVSRDWALTSKTSLGPVIEILNSFVSAGAESDGKRSISTFDHRAIAGGVILNERLGSGHSGLFLTGLLGKGVTKLAIDESRTNSFLQYQNNAVPLIYAALEAGTGIPISEDGSAIKLSVVGSHYLVDQSHARATVSKEERTGNGVELRSETVSAGEQNLAAKARQNILAIKISLAMQI